MTTQQPTQIVCATEAKPVIPKKRRIFANTFGIPGFVFAIISMWFTIAQSLVAMTASGIAEIITETFIKMTFLQVMNIPMLGLCFISMMWAAFSIVMCVLSRFLGTTTKLNQTGFVLSIVSVICSVSLACFSIVYMLLT